MKPQWRQGLGRKVRRSYAGVAGVALVCLAAAGCGGSGNGAASDGDLKVSLVADVTGAGATFHIATADGVRAAMRQINESGGVGGRAIKLSVIDGRSTPEGAQSGIRRAVSSDPNAILLGILSSGVAAVKPVVEQSGVPFISAAGVEEILFPPTEGFFSLGETAFQQASAAHQHALAKNNGSLEGKTVVFQGIATPAIEQIFAKARPIFEESGATIAGDPALRPPTATSFAAQASKIAAAKPDMVVTFESGPGLITVAQALLDAGYEGDISGGIGTSGDEIFMKLKYERFSSARPYGQPAPGSVMAKAAKAADVDATGGYWGAGWAMAYVVAETLEGCQDACETADFIKSIESAGDIKVPGDALFGPATFAADRHYGLTSEQYFKYDPQTNSVVPDGDPLDIRRGEE